MDDSPFFVIGSGRSGTTLLRLMLSSHPRLHMPPETWFLLPLVAELPLTSVLSPAEVDRAVDIIVNHRRWPDMGMAAEIVREGASMLERPTLAGIVDLIYRHHLKSSGKQRCGDKTPTYFYIVPELATLYPDAKFIHLIRDGRDVAISRIDADWDRYYDRKSFLWTHAMRCRRTYRDSRYAHKILEVRYEDLVSDPDTTLRKICAFLDEPFEPAMLNWQKSVETMIPARERHLHSKIERPVSRDAIAVWKSKLSATECFAMEACLHRDLVQLGYPLRFSGVVWRPLLIVSGWLLSAAAPLLKRGIPYLQRRNFLPKAIYF